MNKKDLLDKIQAELTLRLGRKIAQQEILDKCVKFIYEHLDDFIINNFDHPKLTKEKLNKIKENVFTGKLYEMDKSDDELLYGLKLIQISYLL
ncbi:MAG: hypothetical protein ACTSPH_09620 [Promethearchaeota archaeon]